MRKTKFRVWDKKSKKMFYLAKGGMSFLTFHGDSWAWMIPPEKKCILSSDGILMQGTGRKDKTGEDVFESDILKIKSIIGQIYYENVKGEIYWCQSRLSFMVITEDKLFFNLSDCFDIEIIGNKYEYRPPEIL